MSLIDAFSCHKSVADREHSLIAALFYIIREVLFGEVGFRITNPTLKPSAESQIRD